ncbi:MAG: OmpA family protein [Alphaproteobacteria bacterium]|nr:OmpA family protein [Alphaproteobacteria bacterium]
MRRVATVLATVLAATQFAWTAWAGDRLSSDELINRLKPQEVDGLSRSFIPKGVTVEGATKPAVQPSVDLDVNFEYNSAKLTTDALLNLDQLGRALNNPALATSRFQLAGHTDGIGGDTFNQTLSEQRAAAVKDYLITQHAIAAVRLEAVGFGKSRLLDAVHPDAAINRRVQVTNIGG